MGYRSCMPQLCDDATTRRVNRIGDAPPSSNLFFTPQAWRIRPTKSFRADRCGLGDNQSRRSALRIILCLQNCRHVIVGIGPHPGERGHDYAIWKIEISHAVWSKKRLGRLTRARDLRVAIVAKNSFSTHYDASFPIIISITIVSMQLSGKTIPIDIVFFMVECYVATRRSREEPANGRYQRAGNPKPRTHSHSRGAAFSTEGRRCSRPRGVDEGSRVYTGRLL